MKTLCYIYTFSVPHIQGNVFQSSLDIQSADDSTTSHVIFKYLLQSAIKDVKRKHLGVSVEEHHINFHFISLVNTIENNG